VERGRSLDFISAALAKRGYRVDEAYTDIHSLRIASEDLDRDARAISAVAGVRFAEPVASFTTLDTPGDPLYAGQRGYLELVNAPAAWDIQRGQPNVVVAVLDTGVASQHPDLQGQMWVNPGEIPGNGVDDDANGCTDDVHGCSFVGGSAFGCDEATSGAADDDDIGHGTFIAGVVAAASNGHGIVGVARGSRIMSVKVLDCYGYGDTIATARGVTYAARMGARVINLSLGGVHESQEVRDAIRSAIRDYNVVVVAAAGNSGQYGLAFPARMPEVLAVGATDVTGLRRSNFSSFGPDLDVVAVGDGVIGTLPAAHCTFWGGCLSGGPYAVASGTSFAAPQVSGLAALMLSMNSSLSATRVTDIIKQSVTPLAGAGDWAGSGRIDMLKTLQAVQNDRPAGAPCVVQQVIDGESFVCTGGRQVRMLQMDAPNPGQCGGDWAKAAAENIFLRQGQTVYLQQDATKKDGQGRDLAWPIWRGNDGADYNLAIVMVYVGLARAADVGANNVATHDWSVAAEAWARAASWNMWAPGKTFNGGC
jgi:subtilisin family serine protease